MEGSKRLTVRPKYFGPSKDVYQVVDGATVLGNHSTKDDAARQVLELGGRVLCKWERTVIGGQTVPKDFCATWLDVSVGRIEWNGGTSHSGGSWAWVHYAHLEGKGHGGARGREDDRLEAAAQVERAFTQQMAREQLDVR